MTIITSAFIMFKLIKRAKNSFEMKNIKIFIFLKNMNKRHFNFLNVMSERAKYSIFTIMNSKRKFITKFSFIFNWSIKLFNIIMTKNAIIFLRTRFIIIYKFTNLRRI